MKKLTLIFIFTLSISNYAQDFDLRYEIGAITGVTSMQTDYGERGNFGANYSNIGFGLGAAYYISFDYLRKRWNHRTTHLKDHIRLRFELSYFKTNLIHRGKYTQGTSSNTILYNAMNGTSKILNYGVQFEYTLFNMSDERLFDPYFSVGFLGNTNTPELTSSLGNLESNPNLIPTVYNDGIFLEKNNSTAITLGLGARLKPKNYNNKSIYLIDFRWQRFNSDLVEGLAPKINANKYNDWLLFFNVGYIYQLN